MSLLPDWRELLGNIISNPAERDRIANEINVHPITLVRWINGESSPRPHNLRQLLRALSKPQRSQFLPSVEKMLYDLSDFEADAFPQEFFYPLVMDVLEVRATTPDVLRFWSIVRIILQRALKQLDPDGVGLSITVVRCMPPGSDGKIRSLRECVGMGTPPWRGELEEKALFLGVESLVGHVTVSCRPEQVGDIRSNKTFLPAYLTEHEVSAAACPILFANRVAGCLLVSCTQPDYFVTEARLSLIRGFTNLVALAFEPKEFYNSDLVDLYIVPSLEKQQVQLASFRQRVLKLVQEATQAGQHLTNTQAEQLVWQQIEAVLLNLPN